MDVMGALRQDPAMGDLAQNAASLARARARQLSMFRFHVRKQFELALDTLLPMPRVRCSYCLTAKGSNEWGIPACTTCLVHVLDPPWPTPASRLENAWLLEMGQ